MCNVCVSDMVAKAAYIRTYFIYIISLFLYVGRLRGIRTYVCTYVWSFNIMADDSAIKGLLDLCMYVCQSSAHTGR